MIDMEQARILDFGKKDQEQKVIANIQQTLINLKKIAEDHTKRLFDMKVENERIVEENDKLRRALTQITYQMDQSRQFKEWAEHFQEIARSALGEVRSEVISLT